VLKRLAWAFQLLLVTCLYAAAGAACLSYASAVLMGRSPQWRHVFMAATAVLGLHLLNRTLEESPHEANAPLFSAFYVRFRAALTVVAVLAVTCAMTLAAIEGWVVLGLFAACCVAGVVYRLRIIPRPLAALLKHDSLQDIPGTKELFLAVAWTVVVVSPTAFAQEKFPWSALVAAAFTFGLTFMRIVALDVREIQWDAIVGRETIPTVLGLRATKLTLVLLAAGLAAILLAAARLGWASPAAYLLLANIAYACAYLYLYHRRWVTRSAAFEGLADANFLLAGVLAWLYHSL
jgi:4-hydroxy-3-methylbut-2-enyl diphosphate reductase